MLYFYTDVCGIDPTIAATIILIAKVWDIVNDPMMGAIIDRTRSKAEVYVGTRYGHCGAVLFRAGADRHW